MQNELTKLLNIEHPVIQGGMMEISKARLVAAVSNAGGLGTLGQRMDFEAWRDEIKKTKELTDKPFAVNLPMHAPGLDKRLDAIMEEGIKVVVTAAGNPAPVLSELKAAGITVMHVVGATAQAVKVAQAGVDAVIAEGGESGGMVAKNRVSTMVLVPSVAGAIDKPVVAAGGIADARGLVAALALGAQGVQMGTRFLAAEECDAGDEWKQAILKAEDTDTRVVPRGKAQGRTLKEELMQGAMAGIVSGMIHEIETAQNIVRATVEEAGEVLNRVRARLH